MECSISLILFAVLAGICSFRYLLSAFISKNGLHGRRQPPGPVGLPVLGHLHMLGDLPHRKLQRLAKTYGPLMSIRLGFVPALVVSSPDCAELILKTHDKNFASRPRIESVEYISYGRKSMGFAEYGSYWRKIRKLCTTELLSSSKMELFKPMRKAEVLRFVDSLQAASELRCSVDISAMVASLLEDMTYGMVCGFKQDDRSNIKSTLQEVVEIGGQFNVGDYIPCLRPLDLQGLRRRMKKVSKILDGLLEQIIDDHISDAKDLQGKQKDFVDVLLTLMDANNIQGVHFGRDNIKAIMIDILAAAMDTSSTAIEWTIAELLKHPHIMKLVQEELERTVGLNRIVDETDLSKLTYLNAVIKESLRIHPVVPLLVPHESTEDITINGYYIPKKCRVFINTWAIGRDPDVWSSKAEQFYPERFINSNIGLHGHHFQLLPFGSGRRKCPGLQLGLTVVQLIVAQLVHCFNLELPGGMSPSDLDMTEKFGLTLPRANHLVVVPTYRLSS